jgi:hypothetical protein
MGLGSVVDIQNALIAFVKTVEDPNNPGEFPSAGKTLQECGFDDDDLPFFWVQRGRLLRRERDASGVYIYVREFPMLLYVAKFQNTEDTADDVKQVLAANWLEPFYDAIDAAYFTKTPLGANFEIVGMTDLGDTDLRDMVNNGWCAGQVFLPQIRVYR